MPRTPMSGRLALAATLALAPLAADAAAQTPQYHYRHGGENYGVAFVDSEDGMSTRDGGCALYSTDGGTTWNNADTPDGVRGQLRNIFILDDQNVWTVGEGGWVLKSTTRGTSWSLVNSGNPILDRDDLPAKLYDVWMDSVDVGFAVGERGTLVKTTNAWSTWTEIALPTSFYDPNDTSPIISDPGDIYQIHFFNEDDGILSADHGRVLRTDDGGATWTSSPIHYCTSTQHSDLELWSMSFSGSQGWLAGGIGTNNGHAFVSSNSGASWTHIDFLVPIDAGALAAIQGPNLNGAWTTFYGVAALGNGSATLAGYAGSSYEYSGSGSGLLDAVYRCDPFEVDPTPHPTLVQTAMPTYTGTAASPGGPPLRSVFALDDEQKWIVGQFGTIRQWDDTGNEWMERGSDARARYYDGDFVDATTGVIAAVGHRIYKTEDGGVTFVETHIGTDNNELMEHVALSKKANSEVGLAIGTGSLLLLSTNLGDSWAPNTAPTADMDSLCFAGTSNVAYIGGDGGEVFRTDASVLVIDQLNWVDRSLPDSAFDVLGLAFSSQDVGYAVTGGMTLWYTANGGQQWTEVSLANPPATQALNAVATFGDGSKAVAVGAAGVVLVRSGARFQTVDLSALIGNATLNDVTVVGGGTKIVAVGNDGVIAEFDGSTFADATNPSHWSMPKSMTNHPLDAVSFDAADHGFVIGRMSLVVEYD